MEVRPIAAASDSEVSDAFLAPLHMDAAPDYVPAPASGMEQAINGQGYQGVEALVLGREMVMGRFADSHKQAPQQKTINKGARRRKRIYLTMMALFLVWAGSTLFSLNDRIYNQNEKLAERQKEYTAVNQSLAELQHEVERLEDPEYIGQIARRKFGLYLPNETPIIQPQDSVKEP